MCLEPGSLSSLCPAHSPIPGSFLHDKLSVSLYLIQVIMEMMRFEKREAEMWILWDHLPGSTECRGLYPV